MGRMTVGIFPRFRRVLAAAGLAAAACVRPASSPAASGYPHAAEPIGTVRELYDGALAPELAVNTFRNIDRLFPVRRVPRAERPRPLPRWPDPIQDVTFEFRGQRHDLDAYLEGNRVAGLIVLDDGRVVLERYRFGNDERTRWMSMSVAKSITSTLVGAAIRQGHITSLDDPVTRYVPALSSTAYQGVTIRDVLTMSSGVRWDETYTDPRSDRRRLLEAQLAQRPGGVLAVMASLQRAAPPGTVNNYNTGETQVVAEVVRAATGRSLADYLHDRIWSRVGMQSDAFWWLDSPGGVEIGGSGIAATLRDYARFGLFVLNEGIVDGDTVLPPGWIREATSPQMLRGGAVIDYGYLWWTATSPAARQDRAFSAEGIFGQTIWVNPAKRVVVVVLSAWPKPVTGSVFGDGWVFFEAVADQIVRRRKG